jgi:hypothetical protein
MNVGSTRGSSMMRPEDIIPLVKPVGALEGGGAGKT